MPLLLLMVVFGIQSRMCEYKWARGVKKKRVTITSVEKATLILSRGASKLKLILLCRFSRLGFLAFFFWIPLSISSREGLMGEGLLLVPNFAVFVLHE